MEVVDEKKIRERLGELIELCGSAGDGVTDELYGRVMHGTTGVISLLYGRGSIQLSAFQQTVAGEEKKLSRELVHNQHAAIAQVVRGVLSSVLSELDAGLIGSIKQQAAAEVLTDFVALSRAALDEGGQAKNVAAVLAAAAFEDSIRRLGATHAGTVGGEKLADVLVALKTSGFLQGPQVGIAQSYLSFRNHAMHAQWDKIESEAVNSVLGFVEQLVLKHFQ